MDLHKGHPPEACESKDNDHQASADTSLQSLANVGTTITPTNKA